MALDLSKKPEGTLSPYIGKHATDACREGNRRLAMHLLSLSNGGNKGHTTGSNAVH